MSEALKLAQTLLGVTKRAHDRSASFIGTCGEVHDVAAALIDLHERMGRMRLERSCVIDNLCDALFPDSPLENARGEFVLDAMGACQVIRRVKSDLTAAQERIRVLTGELAEMKSHFEDAKELIQRMMKKP